MDIQSAFDRANNWLKERTGSPIHLGTSLLTLAILEILWGIVYILATLLLNSDLLAWSHLYELHWGIIFFIVMPVFMFLKCKIDPCAPQTIRLHYLWGVTNESWTSRQGQMSFWIGKLLDGKLSSYYINNVPDETKKIVSNLYAQKDDNSDEDGFAVQFAGASLQNGQPDTKSRVSGKIKATMDWRITDAIALFAQIIKKSPGKAELDWTDDNLQEKAEALFVRLNVIPDLRGACLLSNYQDVTKIAIQDAMDQSLHQKSQNSDKSINTQIASNGVRIETITVSDVEITDPDALADLSKSAREKVQAEQEMKNLESLKKQLEATKQMLRDAGFAADKQGEEREAALAAEALKTSSINNKLQTPRGRAIEEILLGLVNR
jgi:hypothetical protein